MPDTTRLGLPYPALSDSPDGPRALQALADGIESVLQAGSVSIPVNPAPTGTYLLTFPVPYAAVPNVVVTSGNGYYVATVTAITATGCTINVRDHRNGTATSAGVPVQWLAVGKAA